LLSAVNVQQNIQRGQECLLFCPLLLAPQAPGGPLRPLAFAERSAARGHGLLKALPFGEFYPLVPKLNNPPTLIQRRAARPVSKDTE